MDIKKVGLAYSGSSSHPLGNNPSFGNVGGTPSLGQQSGGSQAIPTPQQNGGSNYQPGWAQPGGTYDPGGSQNFGNVPFDGGFNPSQQGGYAMPYTNWPQMGGYTQFPNQMG
ncbi:unnamed protein product [Adineta steineri]|uniref:Uncharacterized protein n=1 Tax=Adineta steineri TaxID=433720 RepID=A0A815UDS0_9BILA|nr:unnamed protein product [Adineta steineri]